CTPRNCSLPGARAHPGGVSDASRTGYATRFRGLPIRPVPRGGVTARDRPAALESGRIILDWPGGWYSESCERRLTEGDRRGIAHHAGETLGMVAHIARVPALHHHADQRLGAGGAQYDATVAAEPGGDAR